MQELSLMVKRKRGDLGLRKAAEQIGITHTTLSRVESGRVPDLKTFGLICKWLEVEPNQVLGFPTPQSTARQKFQPAAHYRAQKTMSADTAQHLGVLIAKIHQDLLQREA
jgi:DNA-binding Xre family transcriptional regulator